MTFKRAKYFMNLLLLFTVLNNGFATSNKDIFKEAVLLFEQADSIYTTKPDSAKSFYQKSANRFEFLLNNEGIQNGWLHYNLGNAYIRMDETGRAVFHYLMAKQYINDHPDINHNLEYARSLVLDVNKENTKSRFTTFIELIQSVNSWILGFVVFIIYGSTLLLFITRLGKRFPAFYKWVLAGICIPVLMLLILAFTHTPVKGVIFNNNVVVKKGNSIVYENALMTNLNKGTEFTLIDTRGKWIKIELINGKTGWIEKSNAGIIEK